MTTDIEKIKTQILIAEKKHEENMFALNTALVNAKWESGIGIFSLKETALLLRYNDKTLRNMTNPNKPDYLQQTSIAGKVFFSRDAILTTPRAQYLPVAE